MAYQEPKTDWDGDYEPSPNDLNRIEENIDVIKSQATDFDGVKTFNDGVEVTGNVTADAAVITNNISADTGTFGGAVTADAAVITNNISADTGTFGGAVTADSVNTGQGDNELYDMNQNVKTTNSPTFAGLTLTSSTVYNISVPTGSVVIPVGIYVFASNVAVSFQVNTSSGWLGVGWEGGAILSDGSNMRFTLTGASATVRGRKF